MMTAFGSRVATGGILAVIGLLTIKFVIALVTGALGLMAFLLFRVLPLILIAWLAYKGLKYLTKPDNPAYE